jgi:protein ImuB
MRWISVIYSASYPQAEAILRICQEFTPKVYTQIDRFETPIENSDTPIRYQGLLLEVHGSLRLFGGLQQLMRQLWSRLYIFNNTTSQSGKLLEPDQTEQTNLPFKVGSASTAWLAWCMAKSQPHNQYHGFTVEKGSPHLQPCEQQALKDLPLYALDLSKSDRQLMMQCGFETLGDLMKQARDELARRFGLNLLHQFDLLSGTEAFAAAAHPELETYEDQEEMPFHATDQNRIEKVIFQLLCRLQTKLVQRKQKAERLDFQFVQAHNVIPMQTISARGLQNAQDWALLVQYQLGRMKFHDDVRWIKLRCDQLTPAFDHNGTWLPDPNTDKKQWIELCDKLKARLGDDAVKQAYTVPDPRPELSFEYRMLNPTGKNQTGIVNTHMRLPKSAIRPLWLLPTPERLRGRAPCWDGIAEWRLLSGPERIDFGWWGKQACQRDYYRALNREMTQAWLFCEEEFHQGRTFTYWYIHGYFG